MSTNVREQNTYSARLSTKGQLVLPKALREMFDLDAGDMIDFSVVKKSSRKKEVVLKKAPSILDLAGTFKPKKGIKPLKGSEMRSYIEKNYGKG
jgi:AbrB family looped-hinge helix DNA binding protein